MLHNEVKESEWSDEWTDYAVSACHGEDDEHPSVVVPKHELVQVRTADAGDLSHASGETQPESVHEQL